MNKITRAPVLFLFSGQGNQYYQMGRDLYETEAGFRTHITIVDDIVQQLGYPALLPILYDKNRNKGDLFHQLMHTHVAIFAVEYALAQTLIDNGLEPSAVLGVSVGEYAAMVIVGGLSLEAAVAAVLNQAYCVSRDCATGGMLAVLGPTTLVDEILLFSKTNLAALNFDKHFIVSGKDEVVTELENELKSKKITCQRLPVDYGFHSAEIDSAREAYIASIGATYSHSPRIPYYSSMLATELQDFSNTHTWDMVRQPIQLQTTLQRLLRQEIYHFIDVGPSSTLATMVKYNSSEYYQAEITGLLSPYGQDSVRFKECLNKVF